MKTMKKFLAIFMIFVMTAAFAPTASAALIGTNYYIWIRDTQITSNNKDDVFGDGTISFDPETYTLTLTDAFITPASLRNAGITVGTSYDRIDVLNIELIGDNYIYGKENSTSNSICAGINCYYCGTLNFKGDGTATIKGYENSSYTPAGIYGSQSTTVNVESGKITVIGKNFKYYTFTDDCNVKEKDDKFVVTHKGTHIFDGISDALNDFFSAIGDFFISMGKFFKNFFK